MYRVGSYWRVRDKPNLSGKAGVVGVITKYRSGLPLFLFSVNGAQEEVIGDDYNDRPIDYYVERITRKEYLAGIL